MYGATNEQSLNSIFNKYMFYLYISSVCRIIDLPKTNLSYFSEKLNVL